MRGPVIIGEARELAFNGRTIQIPAMVDEQRELDIVHATIQGYPEGRGLTREEIATKLMVRLKELP